MKKTPLLVIENSLIDALNTTYVYTYLEFLDLPRVSMSLKIGFRNLKVREIFILLRSKNFIDEE